TDELIANYQNQVLVAAQQVQTSLRGFLRSREQAESLGKAVKAAVSATETSVRQYRAGTIPFNTVFNLQTTQVQQQDQLALAQGNIALNLINVYRALGGGWEIHPEESLAHHRVRITGVTPTTEPVEETPRLKPVPPVR